jgi:hypothetical protein
MKNDVKEYTIDGNVVTLPVRGLGSKSHTPDYSTIELPTDLPIVQKKSVSAKKPKKKKQSKVVVAVDDIPEGYWIDQKGKLRAKVQGVGIMDLPGETGSMVNGKWKDSPAYSAWNSMLARAYYPKYQAKFPTYLGCSVAPEWLYFSNFKAWFDVNFIPGYQMDKDLIKPGNRIYSESTCRFIPSWLNSLTIDCGASRGSLPLGICHHGYYKNGDVRYRAFCSGGDGKQIHLGYSKTPEAAHQLWQLFKSDIVVKAILKYQQEPVVHLDVVLALKLYAKRLRSNAADRVETLGYVDSMQVKVKPTIYESIRLKLVAGMM